ncbi:MAG: glycosyltransferase family 39 protein, partial [Kiritimatiellae bacterium]|nr:glycosyltransferase family 39 protein [Kiritimatiellia bacterium]
MNNPTTNPEAPRHIRLWAAEHCGLLALLLALAAVAHRAWLASNQFVLAIDTGTLGLMALNILDGDRPIFLYGFCYSGAPLAYLIALSFKLCGVSLFAMTVPIAVLAGLWVWLSFLLFRRLAGAAAGLAAAAVFAFPDRLTSWYTHTPDTSYGAFMFLTTLVLWLAVEIEARDLRGLRLWVWMAVLGLTGGLTFWTNAMVVPYLLTACVPLALHFRRHCWRPAVLATCLPAALLFLLMVSPVLRMAALVAQGPTMGWQPTPARVLANGGTLVAGTLPMFFEWVTVNHRPVQAAGWLFVAAGVITACWTWARPWRAAPRWRAALPPLIMALFLVCYLPHAMAGATVPRYVLPLWTMFLACALALPLASAARGLRVAAVALLVCWMAWNLHGVAVMTPLGRMDLAARLARRAAVTASVKRLGAHHAVMLGDYYFQSEANGMTFLAHPRMARGATNETGVIFVASGKERYLPNAQAAEREPRGIYVCQTAILPAARASLEALGARWSELPLDGVTLLHDLRPPPSARRALPAACMSVWLGPNTRGAVTNLIDRNHRTAVLGDAKDIGQFTLDLGKVAEVVGLDLLPAEMQGLQLPTHGKVELSRDGIAFVEVVPWRARLPVAYGAGEGVYLAGGQGRIAFAFPATQARYVRFSGSLPHGSPLDIPDEDEFGTPKRPASEWMIAEALVYAAAAPEASALEPDSLRAYLGESGVRFTACDRWLSVRLREGQDQDDAPAAFPLFEDPSHLQGDSRPPRFWRFTPSTGTALV